MDMSSERERKPSKPKRVGEADRKENVPVAAVSVLSAAPPKRSRRSVRAAGDAVDGAAGEYYIGPCSARQILRVPQAEWAAGTAGDFRLYHLVPDADSIFDGLPVTLPLLIVYKTDFGAPHHYLIRTTPCTKCMSAKNADAGAKKSGACPAPGAVDKCTGSGRFYVETGPDIPRTFATISALVTHYTTYAYMMPNLRSVELFPWWAMDKDEYVPGKDPFPTLADDHANGFMCALGNIGNVPGAVAKVVLLACIGSLYLFTVLSQWPSTADNETGAAMPFDPALERQLAPLKREIVEKSERYVKQIAALHKQMKVVDGPYASVDTEYDMKKTLALLLSAVMERLDRLEKKIFKERLFENDGVSANSNESQILSVIDLVKGEQEKCPMIDGYEKEFPDCDRKIEWMSDFWRSDPCYAAHGVDGTKCSFIIYLSEVEEHCPRFEWRPPKVTTDAGEDDPTIYVGVLSRFDASTATTLAQLFDAMTDNPLNYEWIKRRLKRTWPAWLAAARSLQHQLGARKKKRIVLHLGFLTKETGFHFGEKSARGGPLGELVQWSDLIGALYVLGHDLVLSSESVTFIKFARADPAVKTSCPMSGAQYVDLLFTDIIGLRHMKRKTPATLNKYKCRMRVLDSFGTQAEFNNPEYYMANKERLGGKKNPWAGQQLDLRQFWTMYPHTADNTFLGFVVESDVLAKAKEHSMVAEKNSTFPMAPARGNCTVIYGKEAYMWRDAMDILMAVNKSGSEIHATVSLDDEKAARYVPSFVRNHGVLGSDDYGQLLRGCKVLLGLGFPFEGPAPLEAIANGAVFINPRFQPPKGRLTDPFFKEKPTLRTLTSQNPYVAEFIGPPHALTLDIKDTVQLRAAVTAVLGDENPAPFLPYEFSAEGMLQRVNTLVELLDTCDTKPGAGVRDTWPPLSALTVLRARDKGQDCQTVCADRGLRCEPSFFRLINNEAMLRTHFNCTSMNSMADVVQPSANLSSDNQLLCTLNADRFLYSCESKPVSGSGGLFPRAEDSVFRLCPCRDFVKGQVALCNDCLPVKGG